MYTSQKMVEAFIDHPDVLSARLGDEMGECEGKVKSLSWDGAIIEVSPEPTSCDSCKLSEWCIKPESD